MKLGKNVGKEYLKDSGREWEMEIVVPKLLCKIECPLGILDELSKELVVLDRFSGLSLLLISLQDVKSG